MSCTSTTFGFPLAVTHLVAVIRAIKSPQLHRLNKSQQTISEYVGVLCLQLFYLIWSDLNSAAISVAPIHFLVFTNLHPSCSAPCLSKPSETKKYKNDESMTNESLPSSISPSIQHFVLPMSVNYSVMTYSPLWSCEGHFSPPFYPPFKQKWLFISILFYT